MDKTSNSQGLCHSGGVLKSDGQAVQLYRAGAGPIEMEMSG